MDPSSCSEQQNVDPRDFRTIADDTYDWESWLSPQGQPVWINPSVERMTGYDPSACLAMEGYPLPLVAEEDRARIGQLLKGALAKTSGNDVEFRILRSTGEARWVAMSWQSSHNEHGRWLGVRLSIRDIHRRKQLELELADALERAKAADRAKSEFLAMVSHELRTPLHCTSGYADLLLRDTLSSKQRRFLQVIREQNQTLVTLVDSILDLSAADHRASRDMTATVNVPDLVRQTVMAFEASAILKGLELTLDVDDAVNEPQSLDAEALGHVLRNLVSNAIKFTDQGHVRVHLELRRSQENDNTVLIWVEDTGTGIQPDQQQQIFAPFVQADGSLSRQHGGIGLGLAIARRFATALGGTLKLDSTPGVGSRFTLRFSARSADAMVADQETPHVVEEIASCPHVRGKNVLVVDDSEPSRALVVEWLRRLGGNPREASSGSEALTIANEVDFDLVLMDIQMPGLDGGETAKRLRAARPIAQPPIVALTANRFAANHQGVVDAGFDDLLLKPVTLSQLRQVLNRISGERNQGAPNDLRALSQRLHLQVVSELRAFTLEGEHPTLLHKLGRQVLKAQASLVDELQDNARRGLWDTVSNVAHTLKGNCSLVGGTEAAQAAATLIDVIESSEAGAGAEAQVSQLLTCLEAFEAQLRAAMES